MYDILGGPIYITYKYILYPTIPIEEEGGGIHTLLARYILYIYGIYSTQLIFFIFILTIPFRCLLAYSRVDVAT